MTLQEDLQRYHGQLQQDAWQAQRQREQMIGHLAEHAEQASRQMDHLVAMEADISAVARSVGGMQEDIARLGALADWALPNIVKQLAVGAERLGNIEEMVANPSQTSAAEMYRRGSRALASGWGQEAVTDLSQAVESYPYHPQSWFNLAVAREQQGDTTGAAEAFSRCARYSARVEPVLAATAVLLAAGSYRRLSQPDRSLELLEDSLSWLDRCAEVHLALAVHHGKTEQLRRALELAPALAADARAAGVGTAEAVATELGAGPASPPARLRAVEQAASSVVGTARRLGLPDIPDAPSPLQLPGSGVDNLVAAVASLPAAVKQAGEVTIAVQRAQEQLDEAARANHRLVQDAQVRAGRAEQAAATGVQEGQRAAVPSGARWGQQLTSIIFAVISGGITLVCARFVMTLLDKQQAADRANRLAGRAGDVPPFAFEALLPGLIGFVTLVFFLFTIWSIVKMRAAASAVHRRNAKTKRDAQANYRRRQQAAQEAGRNVEEVRQRGETVARSADEVRRTMEAPLRSLDVAVRAAFPPERIVPFALPGQLAALES